MWARCGWCKKIGGKYLAIRNWQQTARKNWNYALTKHGIEQIITLNNLIPKKLCYMYPVIFKFVQIAHLNVSKNASKNAPSPHD